MKKLFLLLRNSKKYYYSKRFVSLKNNINNGTSKNIEFKTSDSKSITKKENC